MKTSKHTATPWRADVWEYDLATPKRREHVIVTNDHLIANVGGDVLGSMMYTLPAEEHEANAAYIVRCVNSHAALVEALRAVCADTLTKQEILDKCSAELAEAGEA